MTGLKNEADATRRPLGQRVTAAVLAVAMLVTGCGGAFNEAGFSDSPSSVDPGVAGLELSQLKFTMSEPTTDDEAAKASDTAENPTGSSTVAKAAGSACVISYVNTVTGLSPTHKANIARNWTETDPARPGQLRPRTIDSRHRDMAHADQHHHSYHRRHFTPGYLAAHYTAKFNSINHQNNSASWTVSAHLPLDQANCDRHARKLRQLTDTPTAPHEEYAFPWIGFLTSLAFGMAFAFGGSALIAFAASETIAPWAAPIAGCVVGGFQGFLWTYTSPGPHAHWEFMAQSITNCLVGWAGGLGAMTAKKAAQAAKAALEAAEAVASNAQFTGAAAAGINRASQAVGVPPLRDLAGESLRRAQLELRRRYLTP